MNHNYIKVYLLSVLSVIILGIVQIYIHWCYWTQMPVLVKCCTITSLLFTPFLYGYPIRYFLLKNVVKNKVTYFITNTDIKNKEYTINYDNFWLLKPWVYVHCNYVYGSECGLFGILYFIAVVIILGVLRPIG